MATERKNLPKTAEKRPPTFGGLAAELVQSRTKVGLSVSELHRRTGISRTVIQAYERGEYKPGAGELTRLCEALRVTPNRLLFGTEKPFKATTPLHDVFRLSSEEVRVPLLAVMLQMLTLDERDAVVTLVHSILEARHKEKLQEAIVGLGLTAEVLQALVPSIETMVDAKTAGDAGRKLDQRFQANLKAKSKKRARR